LTSGKSGELPRRDACFAYQVVGEGDVDLVFVPGFVSHQEVLWEHPETARFFERPRPFRG